MDRKIRMGRGCLQNLLNKDIKELNGIILSLFCLSILVISGVVSYKVTNSYALFSDSLKGTQTIELSVDNNLDRSGANEPVLSENMIPVYYDETNEVWRKADSKNESLAYKWYDYDKKMWANSVTVGATSNETTLTLDDGSITNCSGSACTRNDYVSAPLGTVIPMEDILTMQVWIPRYKYKVWNYNLDGTVTSEPQEIQIKFEEGTTNSGEISCEDNIQGTSDGTATGTEPTTSETCKLKTTGSKCTDSSCNGKTYTHPAFTFGEEQLTGFWVGKFEVSSDIHCTAADSSAIESDCNLTTIKPLVKPNVTSWRGAMIGTFENNMMRMNDNNNIYGFATTDDTHMIKNMEWGAVAYLSHSKYGTCTNGECQEVALNSNSEFKTGCGPQSEGSISSGNTCNIYNTTLGKSSATTGNIYGVYGMSGGANEYILSNVVSSDGTTMIIGKDSTSNSGYNGIIYDSGHYTIYTGEYYQPEKKYHDEYTFNNNSTNRSISKLGDGIKEVYCKTEYGWYDDASYLITDNYPWFDRGGSYSSVENSGIFSSYGYYGNADLNLSTRFIVSQP